MMIRVYALLGAFLLTNAGTAWVTYQVISGRVAKKEVKVITNKVEERNDVISEVDETVTVVEKIIYRDREKIVHLPAVDTGITCPIVELTGLRNEAYRSLDPLLFQSED